MEYSKGKVESKTTTTLNLLNNKTDNKVFVIHLYIVISVKKVFRKIPYFATYS
ncbi:MAG TPA: hypothetical protein VLA74_03245 [Nitrososphaeraceae archaeon]|nr:hypothetical protein [Nitrososphaeraceae archaeon]